MSEIAISSALRNGTETFIPQPVDDVRRADKAALQKALDDAKQKLEDMKEQARKAGAPASVRE